MLPTNKDNKPRKPLTSYFRLKERVTKETEHLGLYGDQVNRLTKARWDRLSASEMSELREEFDQEMVIYNEFWKEKQNERAPIEEEKPLRTLERRKEAKKEGAEKSVLEKSSGSLPRRKKNRSTKKREVDSEENKNE